MAFRLRNRMMLRQLERWRIGPEVLGQDSYCRQHGQESERVQNWISI